MKKIRIDAFILNIIFFASGIYILIRVFIPILNPAAIIAGSNYNKQDFYKKIINQATGSVALPTSEGNASENSSEIFSMLFTYLTGIELSNPKTYISSVVPVLQFIDLQDYEVSDEEPDSGPIVVIPKQTDKADNVKNTTGSGINNNNNNISKSNSTPLDNSKTISKVNPAAVNVGKQKLDINKPLVLIFHSHTTEAYNPEKIKDKNFSPDNLSLTVSEVGNRLDYELESKYGISTLHNTTIHDLPTRLGAYTKARPTVQSYLKKYPSLKLIIDLHRDATINKNTVTAIIDKDKYARVMLVVGTKFKNSQQFNLTTQKLYNEFQALFPGFSRKIDFKSSKNTYNQDLSSKLVLMEVGSDVNSLNEAFNSTKVIAKVIAQFLK